MANLETLPAKKLIALIEKIDAESSANNSALIAAGHWQLTGNEIRAAVKAGDARPLFIAYVEINDRRHAANAELQARRRYHGGDKPIKRNPW